MIEAIKAPQIDIPQNTKERILFAYNKAGEYIDTLITDPYILQYSHQADNLTRHGRLTTNSVELFRYTYGLDDENSAVPINSGTAFKLLYVQVAEKKCTRRDVANIMGVSLDSLNNYCTTFKCRNMLQEAKPGHSTDTKVKIKIGHYFSPNLFEKINNWQQQKKEQIAINSFEEMGDIFKSHRVELVKAGLTINELINISAKDLIKRFNSVGIEKSHLIINDLNRIFKNMRIVTNFMHDVSLLESDDPDFLFNLRSYNPPIYRIKDLLNTEISDMKAIEQIFKPLLEIEAKIHRWEHNHPKNTI